MIIIKFQRYENESDEELIFRVCDSKDQIGSWQDVANILNELTHQEYSESKYRKSYQAFQKMLNANRSKFVNNTEQLQDINEKIRELEKARKKLQTEKTEYNKWLREDARDEMILEQIISAVDSVEPLYIPNYIEPIHLDKSYLLAFGDCHYGIEFDIKDVYGDTVNSYSPEIFEDRMNDLLQKTIEIVKKEDINELNVWELGDGIQGILRLNSQLMKLKYGIIDSSVRYANYLANWLNELSNYTRIKFQMVIDSNHNQLRICNAPKNAFSEENMSKVILCIIKQQLINNPNITIIENPTGNCFGQMSTYQCLAIHGEVKNMANAVKDFSLAYQTPIQYLIGAHCHHAFQKEVGIDCETISIRSVIGVDPYGMSLLKTSNAGATLLCFELDGGLTCEYKIKLN